MKTSLDCIPCFVRQSLDAVKMVTENAAEQEHLIKKCLKWINEINIEQTPPAISQLLHRQLRKLTKVKDPYRVSKNAHNDLAKELIIPLRANLEKSEQPLLTAVRYAIMGNVIDLGAKNGITLNEIYAELQAADTKLISGDLEIFKEKVNKAKTILYLADNAGEIFFDRLLIEQLSHAHVTVAVRGTPVINDATIEDAQAAGIHEVAEIIENGSDAPGTILDDCSKEFQRRFESADMIISKGQGNYETLSDLNREIFFLFKIKCPVISAHAGFPLGTYVASKYHPPVSQGKDNFKEAQNNGGTE